MFDSVRVSSDWIRKAVVVASKSHLRSYHWFLICRLNKVKTHQMKCQELQLNCFQENQGDTLETEERGFYFRKYLADSKIPLPKEHKHSHNQQSFYFLSGGVKKKLSCSLKQKQN